MATDPPAERRAEVVLLCRKLGQCIDFFGDAGFRLDSVFPADDPRVATLSGHGLVIRLQRGEVDGGGHLRVPGPRAREVTAPNGARLEFVAPPAEARAARTPPTFVVRRQPASGGFTEGRAGMLYRDLVTGRQDGFLIASLIRVPRGGPIPDYVHWHRVDTQLIYCRAGEVRVVYEDQGPPFVLRAGDCVLQPPGIRHRVLECTDGLEVVEVSSPAEHPTCVDHDLELPTAEPRPDREFDGQRFWRHQASGAVLRPWTVAGFDMRETGVGNASRGAVAARVVRPASADAEGTLRHDDERRFWFVLRGALTLQRGAEQHRLEAGDACVLPPAESYGLQRCSADLEILEVAHNAPRPA